MIDYLFASPALGPARSKFSWQFQLLASDAASGKVGLPDHAMLVVDLS